MIIMDINEFVQDFASCFEDTDISEFDENTVFKNLEEWDSLSTLAIIGMCNKRYRVKVTGGEIREMNTIADVFQLVKTKQ
jgi:acyl carrier protein